MTRPLAKVIKLLNQTIKYLHCALGALPSGTIALALLASFVMGAKSAGAQNHLPYPVIFVHGINGSSFGTWGKTLKALQPGWTFGGALKWDRDEMRVTRVMGVVRSESRARYCNDNALRFSYPKDLDFNVVSVPDVCEGYTIPQGDYYTMEFSHNNLSFFEQGWELAQIIFAVRAAHNNAPKVILVTHSMGGLAARAYLQNLADDPTFGRVNYRDDVKQLIMVATPHQGSPVAKAANFTSVQSAIVDTGNESSIAEIDLRPNSVALGILNNGVKNARYALPTAAVYTSLVIVGYDLVGPIWSGDGDGIVTAFSQNLANVPHAVDGRTHFVWQFNIDGDGCLGDTWIQVHSCEGENLVVRQRILDEILTAQRLPEVETTPATSLTTFSATLNGRFTSRLSAEVWFEWGATPSLGNTLTKINLGTGTSISFSATLPGLTPGASYYFRAVARNAIGTVYGEIKELPIPITAVLDAPVKLAPDPSIAQPPTPVFSWSKVEGAIEYQLMVAENTNDLPTNAASVTCGRCVINVTTSQPYYVSTVALALGKQYVWQVKAKTPGFGYWSTIGSFVVAPSAPSYLAAPVPLYPAGGSTGQPLIPSFQWSEVSGRTSFRILIATTPSVLPTSPWADDCAPPGCVVNETPRGTSFTPSEALNAGATYYWQVYARGLSGPGYWSAVRVFSTTTSPPSDNTPPTGGSLVATAGDGQVFLNWGGFLDVGGSVSSYKLVYMVGSRPGDCNSGFALASGPGTVYTHTGLSNGTTYNYRVCAIDRSGNMSAGVEANATPQQIAAGTGSLRISIYPGGAVISGAQWKLTTDSVWRNSDETISGLALGTYTVEFRPVPNWTTPVNQTVTIGGNYVHWFDGNPYVSLAAGLTSPSNFQVFPNSDGSISLTWSAFGNLTSNDIVFVDFATSTGGTFTTLVGGVPAHSVSWTVSASAFTMGQNYCFRLRGYQYSTALLVYSDVSCAVPNITAVASLDLLPIVSSGENFQIAMKSDGSIWSWGAGSYQQTGYEATGDRAYPGPVLLSDVTKISSGRFHSLAIKPDGRVFAWGGNFNGQLGDGTTNWSAPKQVPVVSGIGVVAAGYAHSVAANARDGTVWAWGDNTYGQLGVSGGSQLAPIQVPGISGVVSVSSGYGHTVTLKSDGTVWAWGYNNRNQAGGPLDQNQTTPQQILAYLDSSFPFPPLPLTNVVKIAAGQSHNLALKFDGTVWAWGDGAYGQLGVLGFCGDIGKALPVSDLTDVIDIAGGNGFSVALKSDGTVWTWGINSAGQLGNGSTSWGCPQRPGQVTGLTNVIAISAGATFVTAVKSDGTVFTWGTSAFGALGTGVSASTTPLPVTGSTGTRVFNVLTAPRPFVRVYPRMLTFPATGTDATSAAQTLTVANIGTASASLYRVGVAGDFAQSNTCGSSLSAGESCTITVTFAPTVGGTRSGSVTVSHSSDSGYDIVPLTGSATVTYHAVATTPNVAGRGTLLGSGNVAHGAYTTVVAIANPGFDFGGWSENSTIVSTNPTYSFQVLSDRALSAVFTPPPGVTGPIVTLSDNGIGFGNELLGLVSGARNATLTNGGVAPLTINAIQIAGANASAFSLQTTGTACAPGIIDIGASCTLSVSFAPIAVGPHTAAISVSSNAGGSPHSISLTGIGQLPVTAPRIAAGSAHTVALRGDGTLWAWGANGGGQLGDGTTDWRSRPVQVGTTGNWAAVAAGNAHTLALRNDGTLWSWGNNGYGQLGNGTTTFRPQPGQLGTATNWSAIAAGESFSVGLKRDGTLWAWGRNIFGELGDGTTTQRLLPVQVGTDSDWTAIAAGFNHIIALKSDGTLWAWGWNIYGQLGDGTTSDRLSPVRIGTATNWSQIAAGGLHTVAIRADGTLWAWGKNFSGAIGDGTFSHRLSPTQIGASADWVAIEGGADHTVAIRRDNTLWSWGANSFGQLGDGSTTGRVIPMMVGTETDWTAVAAGDFHTVALKRDGTLWSWGINSIGELGRGTPTDPKIPGQVHDSTGTLFLNLGVTEAISYILSVSAIGGTVTSNPPGINCGTNCVAVFASGTSVTLSAIPSSGYSFTGWGGACAGTGECTFTIDAAKSVTATFSDAQVPLPPTGVTATAVSTSQINLTWTASTDNVGVTAYLVFRGGIFRGTVYAPTTNFSDTGLAASTNYSYTIAACDAAGNCSAQSAATSATTQALPTYGVTVTNAGGGTVTSFPAGITCGTTCTASYTQGTSVTLTASPVGGYSFIGWSGVCTGTGTCTMAVDGAKNVTASFADTQAPTVPAGLTASVVSASQINIAWNAAGDNVGVAAYQLFRGGVFRATVSGSTSFSDTGLTASTTYSYTVAACDAAGNCSAQSAAVNATTQALPTYGLTVTNAGGGTVTSSPAGISCGATCTASFTQGTNVTLTASPSAGFSFTGWSGACTGTGACTVTVDAAKSVTAAFADTQAPGVPTGLTATAVSATQIILSWTAASDNFGVTAYKLYRNAVLIQTLSGATLFYSDTGLSAATTYSYTVAACDAAGNCSAQSASASANVPPIGSSTYTANLEPGFNLIGNSLNITLNVATTFGNQDAPVSGVTSNIVSIWKWNAVDGRWAFYSPQLTAAGNASYAAARNYEVLATINPGEGYWVNAILPMTLPVQSGTGFNWTGFNFAALPPGFNLIAHADTVTPSLFNQEVSQSQPAPGVVPTTNFVSLWAWDAVAGNWYFYSPLLESSGGLPAVKAYADSRGYRHFQDYNKQLGIGTGFWVNRP